MDGLIFSIICSRVSNTHVWKEKGTLFVKIVREQGPQNSCLDMFQILGKLTEQKEYFLFWHGNK